MEPLKRLREEPLKIPPPLPPPAASQAERHRVIPHMSKYDIHQIVEAALSYSQRHNRTVVFAYLLLPGINDKPADVRQLAKWFAGKNVMINVLEYNETVLDLVCRLLLEKKTLLPRPAKWCQQSTDRFRLIMAIVPFVSQPMFVWSLPFWVLTARVYRRRGTIGAIFWQRP